MVTPLGGVLCETRETPWISVRLRKRYLLVCTLYECFPKLNVAGSIPVSRSIFTQASNATVYGLTWNPVSAACRFRLTRSPLIKT